MHCNILKIFLVEKWEGLLAIATHASHIALIMSERGKLKDYRTGNWQYKQHCMHNLVILFKLFDPCTFQYKSYRDLVVRICLKYF